MKILFYLKVSCASSCCLLLSGCFLGRTLSEIGDAPELSRIQDPTLSPNYRPVSMPMPAPESQHRKINSLWETGSRAFFKDQRANKVGDILTVFVKINDKAKFDNTTTMNKQSSSKLNIPAFLGYEKNISHALPTNAKTLAPGILDTNSTTGLTGSSKYDRKDNVEFKVAATIIQVLPNGNFVVQGRQEVTLFNEMRIINIAGIARREDVTSQNTIPYEKLAEARIGYGGQGDITDLTTFPITQQILNKISPW